MARILLIEDNEMNRDMLSRRLTRAGHVVACAASGARGLELAFEQQPDLILVDLRLPDLSGWDVARKLKDDQNLRRVPLIALTAHVMEGDREKALAAGCDEYETKPVDFPRLLAKIQRLLESSRGTLPPETLSGGSDTLPLN